MNAIVEHDSPRLPSLQSGGSVKAIVPQDFEGAWRIATAVCKAGMAPAGLDSPEKAMVAIMHGMEVGLTPMAALQSIAVVNGRPTIWGDGAIGLVRGSGKMEWLKEEVTGEGEAMVATCEVKRKGEPESIKRSFSVADAKAAGLWMKTGRNGAPTPWVTYPKRMLTMRARAFALRDAFADVLRGLGIAEEIQDIREPKDVTPPPPPPPAPDAPQKPTQEPADEQEQAAPPPPTEEASSEFYAPDFLEELENNMATAKDEAEVEQIWADMDVEATLADQDDWQENAMSIRDRHFARVNPMNAG